MQMDNDEKLFGWASGFFLGDFVRDFWDFRTALWESEMRITKMVRVAAVTSFVRKATMGYGSYRDSH
jgi:hypothetical protein